MDARQTINWLKTKVRELLNYVYNCMYTNENIDNLLAKKQNLLHAGKNIHLVQRPDGSYDIWADDPTLFQTVSVLPADEDAKENVIYLLPNPDQSDPSNLFLEYIFHKDKPDGQKWELIGGTGISPDGNPNNIYIDWRNEVNRDKADGTKANPYCSLVDAIKAVADREEAFIFHMETGSYKENVTTLSDDDPNLVFNENLTGNLNINNIPIPMAATSFAIIPNGPVKINYGVDSSVPTGQFKLCQPYIQFSTTTDMEFFHIENLYFDNLGFGGIWFSLTANAKNIVIKNITAVDFSFVTSGEPTFDQSFIMTNVQVLGRTDGFSLGDNIITNGSGTLSTAIICRGPIMNGCNFSKLTLASHSVTFQNSMIDNLNAYGISNAPTTTLKRLTFINSLINTIGVITDYDNIYNYNSKFGNLPQNVSDIMITQSYAN